jgi:hypothetical protein
VADPSETTQVSLGAAEPEAAELLDAIRSMSAQIGSLQTELQGLRAQARGGLPPTEARELPGWDDRTQAQRQSSQPWIRSLDGPGPRQPAVPRLLLEVVFLVVVSVAVALAQLDPPVIVAVIAAAWALVALAEWLAAREARRKAELSLAPFAGGVLADDPSWFSPPVERVPLEPVPPAEEDTDPGTTRSPVA